ncbi:MAG: Gldg family protein [Halioglobus sp.]
MAPDGIARRVAQKETRLFFASPVAWLFLGSFAALSLFVFFWVESFFARNIADIRPLFEWMPVLLIFLCSALTMRMWSEERRTGTLEHVMTQPVALWRFVLGKFRACFSLLILALAATLPLPVTVELIADLDWGPVVAGYIATALLGAAYLSAGLSISALTDNPIVSLIGSVALCGILYLVGSGTITDFLDNQAGEMLRLLGSGSRFESISRGVVDVRDLFYYVSVTIGFLAINVYLLEKERWARAVSTARHRNWRAATALLLVNLVLANVWLHRAGGLRIDVTEGRLYSISEPTREFIDHLEEPLLLRGYFSAKTHPLLAPLVPQLRDLMKEYEIAGRGRIRVEFVDPAEEPELEKEANERYNINASPFQVADRYQAALVNSYFDILVSYGGEYETLGFADLIEVRSAGTENAEVMLRNPEYDITRAIKDVLYRYQVGGNLFDTIDHPVEFIGYVSDDDLLPDPVLNYKDAIGDELARVVQDSGGKFSFRFIEPEAGGGALARHIADEWGFSPMVSALGDGREFFFYLTLADDRQVVQLPTENFDPDAFRAMLDAGLKRFASGFTKTVALAVPPVDEQMARFNLGAPTFANLEQAITRNYSIRMEDLADGSVDPEADILAVVAPHQLSDRAIFAMDQFLMRGGTVILATSPFTAEISGGALRMQPWESGLDAWLSHFGVRIGRTLVLDEQHTTFPAPVLRRAGDFEFRDMQMVDYPYFIDLRGDGLAQEHPITAGLPQLTMAWASPLEVKRNAERRVTSLLRSSPRSWLSDNLDVMPSTGDDPNQPPPPDPADKDTHRADEHAGEDTHQARELGVILQGRFSSFFAAGRDPEPDRGHPSDSATSDSGHPPGSRPRQSGEKSELTDTEYAAETRDYEREPSSKRPPGTNGMIERSPESARIVLFASNDFLDDQVLNASVTASGTQYLGPLELFTNTLDWALNDDQLVQIRSRAHFNRSLPPMDRQAQAFIEYFNYGLSVLWLVALALVHWLRKILRRKRYMADLNL